MSWLLFIAGLADLTTTLMLLQDVPDAEANPVAAFAYRQLGVLGMAVLKLASFISVVWCATVLKRLGVPKAAYWLYLLGIVAWGSCAALGFYLLW